MARPLRTLQVCHAPARSSGEKHHGNPRHPYQVLFIPSPKLEIFTCTQRSIEHPNSIEQNRKEYWFLTAIQKTTFSELHRSTRVSSLAHSSVIFCLNGFVQRPALLFISKFVALLGGIYILYIFPSFSCHFPNIPQSHDPQLTSKDKPYPCASFCLVTENNSFYDGDLFILLLQQLEMSKEEWYTKRAILFLVGSFSNTVASDCH